jgi:hypothetical protein
MVDQRNDREMTMSVNVAKRAHAGVATMAVLVALLVCFGVKAERASAMSQIFGYSSTPSFTQAGGHPTIVTNIAAGNRLTQGPQPYCGCNDPKDIILHAPRGVIANPHVVSTCDMAEAALFSCSPDAQVGLMEFELIIYHIVVPIYRTTPQKGQGGLFFFSIPLGNEAPQYIVFNSRTDGDYGLNIESVGITHALPSNYFNSIFWGVPAEHRHDPLRFNLRQRGLLCFANPQPLVLEDKLPPCAPLNEPGASFEQGVASSLPIKPLIQNPTACVGPLESSLETVAYDREVDRATSVWPETTGCDRLSFDPSLSANPTTTASDTPSGVDIKLRVPQFQDPSTPSPSEIKATTVEFPPGFSLDPNAADGKVVCSDAEAMLGTREPADCPENAKVGTLTIDSSALPGPIAGAMYLGEPKSGDRYRVILTAFGFGTAVKIAGSVEPDPDTGQLKIVFDELPETPLQEFDMHVFGSERGLLATPNACGTYPVVSTFTPWDEQILPQTSTQFFNIDSGPNGSPCPSGPRPFRPAVEGGSEDNTAGMHSPFSLKLTRNDGEQNFAATNVTAPPGLTATLKGVPYCPESAIGLLSLPSYSGLAERAAPACPAASQIGSVATSEGAGTRPLYTPGNVYLAGPYRGAPLSMVAVIPAVSGPYDLGNVTVRIALQVDPRTAQVTAISDPLPQVIGGIPVRAKSILLNLSRPNFALNPTNCERTSIGTSVLGSEGATSVGATPYQVANCADLDFGPKVSLRVSGGVRRSGFPALHAKLTARGGQANIARAAITLPHSEFLANAHLKGPCTQVQFAAGHCPPGSVIGHAKAESPLLANPLEGPVYLRSSHERLPNMVADLHGQFHVELVARIDSVHQRLRTRFDEVPDVPVSRVRIDLLGGKKGLLENSEPLCLGRHRAKVLMVGQNGARRRSRVRLKAPCGRRSKQRKHSGHNRGRHSKAGR